VSSKPLFPIPNLSSISTEVRVLFLVFLLLPSNFTNSFLATYIFIDEPELNLHPENQRLITQVLANLVNIGIKVFITTHSDYII
jgi:predicted ATPase